MFLRFTLSLIMVMGAAGASGEAHWYKGATHLHSLWSDGNAAPEYIIQWYRDQGWDFVCPSDHNILLQGRKFFPIADDSRLTPARVAELQKMFGEEWVEIEGDRMQLKTLDELREHFEKPGEFILLSAEEMTTLGGNPHINALNLRDVVPGLPNEGDKTALIQHYIDAIAAQSEKYGVPMIAHLNHVNFADRITTEEIIGTKGLAFIEVYNGHPSVYNHGIPDAGVPSNERHWDVVNSMKLLRNPEALMYGVATDDSHEYFDYAVGKSNPGRGWIMVRSEALEPDALIAAMQQGDFYGSSGVTLKDIRRDATTLGVTIDGEDGVTYTTQYVGTRKGFNEESKPALDAEGNPKKRSSLIYSESIGEVLHETTDLESTYTFNGDELYVRARIISSRHQPNPHESGDVEMAWVQPVLVK